MDRLTQPTSPTAFEQHRWLGFPHANVTFSRTRQDQRLQPESLPNQWLTHMSGVCNTSLCSRV